MSDTPSVRRALPPVGVQSTAEQLLQTTTVWLWLKTVVLHRWGTMSGNSSMHIYGICAMQKKVSQAARGKSADEGLYIVGVQAKQSDTLRLRRHYAVLRGDELHQLRGPEGRQFGIRQPCGRASDKAWAGCTAVVRGQSRAHLEAPLALDVHEEGVGRLHQPLPLVLLLLEVHGRVQEVNVTRQHLPTGRTG